MPRTRIERMMREGENISLRLGHVFGINPEVLINLQRRYEVRTAQAAIGQALSHIKPYRTAT